MDLAPGVGRLTENVDIISFLGDVLHASEEEDVVFIPDHGVTSAGLYLR